MTAIKHAEKVLAELIQRDDADYSTIADATYRREVAQVSLSKYRQLCIDHNVECPISASAAAAIDGFGVDRTPEQERLLDNDEL